MTSINQQLAELLLQHQHYLLRVESGVVREMQQPFLTALEEVEERLSKALKSGTLGNFSAQRSIRLQRELSALLAASAADSGRGLITRLEEVIQAENEAVTGIFKDTMPYPVDTLVNFERVPLETVQAMIQEPVGGKTLNGRLVTLQDNAADRVKTSLATSIILGEGAEKAARRIRDLTVGKTMYEARRIARTEVHRAATATQRRMYESNRDVLNGLQWMATFDQRTCPDCAQLDGMQWFYKGSPPLEGAPEPPLHPLCRCSRVPQTKSWAELGFTKDDLKDFPGLADLDGEAARLPSYSDWFKQQPKDVQREILGPKKYDAWKDGKFKFKTAPQAMGKNPRPLAPSTLSGLRGLGKDAAPKKALGPLAVKDDVKASTLRRTFSSAAESAGVPRKVLADYYREVRAGNRAEFKTYLYRSIEDGRWTLPSGQTKGAALSSAVNGVANAYAQQLRTAMAYSASPSLSNAASYRAIAGRAVPALMHPTKTQIALKQTLKLKSDKTAAKKARNVLDGMRFMVAPAGRAAGADFIVQNLAAQGHGVANVGGFSRKSVRAFAIDRVEDTDGFRAGGVTFFTKGIASKEGRAFFEAAAGSTVGLDVNTWAKLGAAAFDDAPNPDARGVRDVFHEYGHVLEAANPEIRKAANRFIASRTKEETAQSLRAVTGQRGYRSHEVTKADNFYAPYTGKVYEKGDTEAVSMATEHLPGILLARDTGSPYYATADAVAWATYDPGHAAFLLNVIRATPPL